MPEDNLTQSDLFDLSDLTTQTTQASNDEAGSEYLFVLPVIVIVGLCGNIVSMVTILNTRLRKVGFFDWK
jgi:hypothetical protein